MSEYQDKCPFCRCTKENEGKKDNIHNRTFYDDSKWFAFLAAPYYTKGNCIVAPRNHGQECPDSIRRLDDDQLETMGPVLLEISEAIESVYCIEINKITYASLRGKVKHFHFHLTPVNSEEEKI